MNRRKGNLNTHKYHSAFRFQSTEASRNKQRTNKVPRLILIYNHSGFRWIISGDLSIPFAVRELSFNFTRQHENEEWECPRKCDRIYGFLTLLIFVYDSIKRFLIHRRSSQEIFNSATELTHWIFLRRFTVMRQLKKLTKYFYLLALSQQKLKTAMLWNKTRVHKTSPRHFRYLRMMICNSFWS